MPDTLHPTYLVGGLRLRVGPGDISMQLPAFTPFAEQDPPPRHADIELRLDPSLTVAPTPDYFFTTYAPATDLECRVSHPGQTATYAISLTCRRHNAPVLQAIVEPERHAATLTPTPNTAALHFAIWMAYALTAADWHASVIHASCIIYHHKAILLLGESGTGKSTHAQLWLKHIAGSQLLNDDSPAIRLTESGPAIYGSPWSGKTPCHLARQAPLGAVVRLSQAPLNSMSPLTSAQALAALLPSLPPVLTAEPHGMDRLMPLLDGIVRHVPCYHLQCRPDAEAAQLCRNTLAL